MYKKYLLAISLILLSSNSLASSDVQKPFHLSWPFEGIFGSFDRQSAQRGAQIYLEVCSACHGLNHLYYRNLKDLGFLDAEIKEIAANKQVLDIPNENGEKLYRKALPLDLFVSPYPNEESARAANNGALPVDLSLIIKARHDGANYLYSLLTGYIEPPNHINLMDGLYYNPYFEGEQISMPPPLFPDQVTFLDKTPATVEQMAKDITVFLQWAAEPEMEHRKSMGLKVMLFLVIFTILFIIAKKRIWKKIK